MSNIGKKCSNEHLSEIILNLGQMSFKDIFLLLALLAIVFSKWFRGCCLKQWFGNRYGKTDDNVGRRED